mmetsp:Transcript_30885/g.47343  ORF Transcript_30885/g.47343 Transcript_30885/m.47343 type:complete len:116 (+) Transcript_30885:130-477(+)|eukprot:CAMPEP_0118679600 /NCGR_PEP_ID=MMETSP0800-20121206/3876_1 /TAXON_ID=210618 ORGANISM="Striatella unipunctata, Strain CCMP2910" /NCGR_SAMPLE_ID=MMETSP0800 /ASSEMBLY_ACC=CAM_ASM_000638 /LENGTH=115 /DNA_ID=CAMNT_0006575609 /DNA_START=89 /DNA_END=436 /DNA_ORIENTATION=+
MTEKPLSQNAILAKYRELNADYQQLITKVTELESERNEHMLVEETLKPLDPQRRAFRLVGGVLVERTVGEVLPNVSSNRENLDKVIDTLQRQAEDKQKEANAWREEHNITTQGQV